MKVLGNFCVVQSGFGEMLIQKGILNLIDQVLSDSSSNHKKDAVWLLSNLSCERGEECNADAIVDSPNLMIKLVYMTNHTSYEIKKETLMAISNICLLVTGEQRIEKLFRVDLITRLDNILSDDATHGHMLLLSLSAIDSLLGKSEMFREQFDKIGGVDTIVKL